MYVLLVYCANMIIIIIMTLIYSVMPSPVLASVKTEGGLRQQTVAKTVWLSSGTHSQRKILTGGEW